MPDVWTESRAERHRMLRVLQRYFQRVPAECYHCGWGLGDIYGDENDARCRWVDGQRGQLIFIDGPVTITCPGKRCGKKYFSSEANLCAAYRAALAKPEGRRVLRIPYDLKA